MDPRVAGLLYALAVAAWSLFGAVSAGLGGFLALTLFYQRRAGGDTATDD